MTGANLRVPGEGLGSSHITHIDAPGTAPADVLRARLEECHGHAERHREKAGDHRETALRARSAEAEELERAAEWDAEVVTLTAAIDRLESPQEVTVASAEGVPA